MIEVKKISKKKLNEIAKLLKITFYGLGTGVLFLIVISIFFASTLTDLFKKNDMVLISKPCTNNESCCYLTINSKHGSNYKSFTISIIDDKIGNETACERLYRFCLNESKEYEQFVCVWSKIDPVCNCYVKGYEPDIIKYANVLNITKR